MDLLHHALSPKTAPLQGSGLNRPPFSTPVIPLLAARQHRLQGALLRGVDAQIVLILDLDPHGGVGAVIRGFSNKLATGPAYYYRRGRMGGKEEHTQRWTPRLRTLITFGLVDIVGDGDELRVGEVVGELLAEGCRPG